MGTTTTAYAKALRKVFGNLHDRLADVQVRIKRTYTSYKLQGLECTSFCHEEMATLYAERESILAEVRQLAHEAHVSLADVERAFI